MAASPSQIFSGPEFIQKRRLRLARVRRAIGFKAKQDEPERVSKPCALAPALKGAEKSPALLDNAVSLSGINPPSPEDTPSPYPQLPRSSTSPTSAPLPPPLRRPRSRPLEPSPFRPLPPPSPALFRPIVLNLLPDLPPELRDIQLDEYMTRDEE
ncbi:hypothetical protein PTTG_01957 [Puccinia triticina 1-1 BBBD Race 1]|uniref:Uncharacterized protein n=1 Tax=Puccinia triticina (isolate 1-1 / race 1 (BBBD)) TaxID=630390 RepID=A0A0C4EMG7_PUCT1|nr:hypothetical protein PTTG_01957 [Puccinia triticina 1-1 BBBD Race 1]WAR56649.1 hypothetical protein PtB15_7B499 [Puccinia triticina]